MRLFGELSGLYEGANFKNRLELSQSGVHRPTQAGISGSQKEGSDSIIVSGGYEDYGDIIIYTGHGGRDMSTGNQTTNQELIRGNLALAESCKSGLPIRVIRGAHKKSNYAPKDGYRYDGLFRVEDYWKEKGKSGFIVWRFRLRKIEGNLKNESEILQEEKGEYKTTKRVETRVQRIVRDTELSKKIKKIYDFKCQICEEQIMTSSGPYAEAAHIKPLGAPHNGPDSLDNILCLCPNHHVMFDYGGFAILQNYDLIGIQGRLTINNKHQINKDFTRYHLEHFYDEKNW